MNDDGKRQTFFGSRPLLHSFLLVSTGYLAFMAAVVISSLVLARIFFSEALSIWNSEPDNFNAILAADPGRVFPQALKLVIVLLVTLAGFAIGYLVARLSRAGHQSHAVFLALILFVQFLQVLINAHEALRSSVLLCMVLAPIATLIGGSTGARRDAASGSH
jgi:hypothetical protein